MLRINLLALVVIASMSAATVRSDEVIGTVVPIPTLHFQGSPQKDWPVTAIHFKVGDRVKAGDCLVELDPAQLPQQKAQGELEAAQRNIEVVKSHLAIQQKLLKRCTLLNKQRAACEADVDQLKESVTSLEAGLAQAQAAERVAIASLGMAKYDFDHYQRINTPIAGEVVDIRCSLGLVARATDKQLVWIEVIDSSRVYVRCLVESKLLEHMLKLKDARTGIGVVGSSCTARVVAVPRLVRDGKITVIVEADNPRLELVCGQEVKVSLF